MNETISLNPNKIVRYLGKPANDFTRRTSSASLENNIRMINFRYVGGDGRLKRLNFVINNLRRTWIACCPWANGWMVPVSSFVAADSSDLYVVRYKASLRQSLCRSADHRPHLFLP